MGLVVVARPGVFVAIAGRSINAGEDLASSLLTETPPGDEVTLAIIGECDRRQLTVTLGERPESTA